jgi:hypothetical protein
MLPLTPSLLTRLEETMYMAGRLQDDENAEDALILMSN